MSKYFYPEDIDKVPPGMYLGMFHGRGSVDEQLEDWGFAGPVIGPLTGVHTTYRWHIRVGFARFADARHFFPEAEYNWVDLKYTEDLLEYDGKFYGDYTIFNVEKK